MEKLLEKYGVIILLYLVIIFGIFALCTRMRNLEKMLTMQGGEIQKAFTN